MEHVTNIGLYRTKPPYIGQNRTVLKKIQNIGQYRNIGRCGRPDTANDDDGDENQVHVKRSIRTDTGYQQPYFYYLQPPQTSSNTFSQALHSSLVYNQSGNCSYLESLSSQLSPVTTNSSIKERYLPPEENSVTNKEIEQREEDSTEDCYDEEAPESKFYER